MKSITAIIIALVTYSHVISAQVGIGKTNPHESSILHIESTTQVLCDFLRIGVS